MENTLVFKLFYVFTPAKDHTNFFKIKCIAQCDFLNRLYAPCSCVQVAEQSSSADVAFANSGKRGEAFPLSLSFSRCLGELYVSFC